jgi:prophage antirepressor-like protein
MQNLPYSSSSLSTVEFIFGGSLLRTINEGDTIWFVAKDVCESLGLDDTSKAVSRLDEDEKGTKKVRTLGGEQSLLCVNESGLYALILRSNKPQAKPFRKWVTNMQNLPYFSIATVEFNFGTNPLRTFKNEKGEIWFCLKDACDILEIGNPSDVVKRLDPKGVDSIEGQNGRSNQPANFINEPNLYRVIFRSDKPQAKAFQDWVFEEVLPTIRKTGSYGNSTLPAFILDTRLSAPQKIILLILAHQADAEGKCQISFSKLARISSVDSSWVIKSIYHLVANGFLSVSKTQNRNGSAGVNIYTVPEQCRVHGAAYQLSEAQYNQLQATKHLINALADLNLHHKQ